MVRGEVEGLSMFKIHCEILKESIKAIFEISIFCCI